MILSDWHLRRAIRRDDLVVDPMDDDQLQPASIDLRLDRYFRRLAPRGRSIDPARGAVGFEDITRVADDGVFALQPGEFALAATFERVALSADLCARWEGKSSIGRLGLLTHVTAGFIDPGFDGHITLELSNLAPLPWVLRPGMRIGQLCVMEMSGPAQRPYGAEGVGSHYQGQRGPTPSRAHVRFTHGLPEGTPA